MKKIFKIFIFVFVLALLFGFSSIQNVKAISFFPLDEILSYEIKVDVNDDATLKMNYKIKWKVLDSSEEAVNEIRVGVANRFVKDIKSNTNVIKRIKLETGSQSQIVCTLNKYYYENEIIDLDFSITQKRIYTKNVVPP